MGAGEEGSLRVLVAAATIVFLLDLAVAAAMVGGAGDVFYHPRSGAAGLVVFAAMAVLAAHAAGLTDVIVPERNRPDLEDVPEGVREAMRFHPVMSMGEVLELALEREPSVSRVHDGPVAA